jgi:putative PIN family toxin of toxin-antitoxin system
VKIVLDTNVLVSGLLSPHGYPARIVDLVTSSRVTVLYDDRILAEYRDVLGRPRLRISGVLGGMLLDYVENAGLLTSAPPLAVVLPDPDDLPFLEVAEAGAAEALVTGNARHYVPTKGEHRVLVLSPAMFVKRWSEA